MIILKPYPCETCGKERNFKFNTKTEKVYMYKSTCQTCTLIERNKKQNFSPRKHPIVDYFESIDTQEKAYIFGFLWADGCMRDATRKKGVNIKSLMLGIHPKDKEILDFIVAHFGGSYKDITFLDKRSNKRYNRSQWHLNSKEVYMNFIGLNFRKNSLSVPNHLFNHFLRGLIDGDGCFHVRKNKTNSIEIKITSNYDQDWSFITDRIDFPHTIARSEYNSEKRSNLHILGDKVQFLTYLYNDASFYLKRKYRLAEKFIIRP